MCLLIWEENVVYLTANLVIREFLWMAFQCTNFVLNGNQKYRGGKWKCMEGTFICSKHFVDRDFVENSRDTNTRRKRKHGDAELKYRFLKDDAYPTVFPNCLQYMSKEKPADRPPLSSSAARQETVEKRKEEERLRKVELDAVMS